MSQYGQGYPPQGPPDQQAPPPPPPPSGGAGGAGAGGHGRRRLYPQQQYDFSATQQPAMAGQYDAAQAGYGAQMQQPQDPYQQQSQMFTPAGAPQQPAQQGSGFMDQLSNQFNNMTMNGMGGGGAGSNRATPGPAGPAYGQPLQPQQSQQPMQHLPLNQLYNIDLMQNIPPPISDLDLPPPPLVVPQEATVTGNPEANAPHEYIRSTLNVIPRSNQLLKKSKLPFALTIRPFTSLTDANENVPVIEDTLICRCRRCRCYINPFVTFMDQTHRWKCNMCGLTNEVPSQFDWDPIKNVRQDRFARKEINYGVCEFITPPEYMVRPPQPPIYVFVIDVSVNAIQSGLLATAARTIKESLDRIPNQDGRSRVGFIAVDGSLHYFSIPLPSKEDAEPSTLVVSDLDDPFLPLPSTLLVNLSECRENIDKLLDQMHEMFGNNVNSSNALGSALKAANKMINSIGGKIICITASLPNVGIAKLEVREDRKVLGTTKESQLLQTANSFYKSFAVECTKSQVTIDMFLFGPQYQDVASLSNLPRYTGGQTYFYPGWTASRPEDAIKFAHELGEHLSQEFAMEGVLRVRSCTGLRMNTFYGNFFNRSSDLCSFPTFPRDQSYVVEVAIDENISKPWVSLQAGILHTTCRGERRVRVITATIPTSENLRDIYASADQLAITAYLNHKAFEKMVSNGTQAAHDELKGRLVDMLQTYKKELMASNIGGSSPLQFCANLRMLPLLINSMLKHVGYRKSAQIPTDLRSSALCMLTTMPLKYLIRYLYPNMYALHELAEDEGQVDEETGHIKMPPKVNLTYERVAPHGLYLLDDGLTQFLFVGRDAVPALLSDAFGVDNMAEVKGGKTELPIVDGSVLNQQIRNVIGKSRERTDSIIWPHLYIVKDDGDPSLKLWFSTHLVEDRTDSAPSYQLFLQELRDKLNN